MEINTTTLNCALRLIIVEHHQNMKEFKEKARLSNMVDRKRSGVIRGQSNIFIAQQNKKPSFVI